MPIPHVSFCLLPFSSDFIHIHKLYFDRLQAKCKELVCVRYAKDLDPLIEDGHNQDDYFTLIDRNVEILLSHGFFLRGFGEKVSIDISY